MDSKSPPIAHFECILRICTILREITCSADIWSDLTRMNRCTKQVWNDIYPGGHRLDVLSDQTRFVVIQPGYDDNEIQCDLRTASTKDLLEYRCLSYVWGTSANRRRIWLNEHWYSITANLFAALCCLRRNLIEGFIWIDALCINQNDEIEKAEQVPRMGRIYQNASEVLIWLGPEPIRGSGEDSEDTIAGAVINEMNVSHATSFMKHLANGIHLHDLPPFNRCTADQCPSSKTVAENTWRATAQELQRLMNAPWFERTWTIQEVVLARNATLFYESTSIDWSDVARAWINWNRHINSCCRECIARFSREQFEIPQLFATRILDLLSAQYAWEHGQPLLTSLLKFRSKGVTEPKDKVYGLLGLQSHSDAISLEPHSHVGETNAHVFTRFASGLIEKEGWIVPLHLDLNHWKVGCIPSWVPDWTYHNDDPSEYSLAQFRAASTYECTMPWHGDWCLRANNSLLLRGIELGEILEVGRPYRLARSPSEEIHQIDTWLDWLHSKTVNRHKHDEEVVIKHAIDQTLFAGKFHVGMTCRDVESGDIGAWYAQIEYMRGEIARLGPRATFALTDTMGSHFIACLRRRLFLTREGYYGLCPEACQSGDRAFVLDRCRAIIFLRRLKSHGTSDEERYIALSHGYIHGLMSGEAAELPAAATQVLIV